jgi:maleate cis-trans isomerase
VLEVISYDFHGFAPTGVALVGVTCHMEGWAEDQYARALELLEPSAKYLGERKVDFLLHVATPPVVSRGVGFDLELIERLESIAECPATTSARAIINALRHFSARRIVLVTAFIETLIEQLSAFLSGNGIEVIHVARMPGSFTFLHDISADIIRAAAREGLSAAPDAQAILIPGGQIPSAPLVASLEAELGVPVIAQNHSDFWTPFRDLGINDVEAGHGMLLDSLGDTNNKPSGG